MQLTPVISVLNFLAKTNCKSILSGPFHNGHRKALPYGLVHLQGRFRVKIIYIYVVVGSGVCVLLDAQASGLQSQSFPKLCVRFSIGVEVRMLKYR